MSVQGSGTNQLRAACCLLPAWIQGVTQFFYHSLLTGAFDSAISNQESVYRSRRTSPAGSQRGLQSRLGREKLPGTPTNVLERRSAHLRRRLKKDGPHRSGVPHHGRGGVLDHVDEPRQTVAVDL
eukprot:COSAG01_NODE_1042_length_11958_cov_10.203558_12_plen_125_part_00